MSPDPSSFPAAIDTFVVSTFLCVSNNPPHLLYLFSSWSLFVLIFLFLYDGLFVCVCILLFPLAKLNQFMIIYLAVDHRSFHSLTLY